MSKKRVAIIFGGQSSEHEVSRVSAQSVIENIDKQKYDVEIIGITKKGQWLKYNGPVEKIGSGDWEAIAQKKLLESKPSESETESEIATVNSARQVISGNTKTPIDVVFPVLHGCNGEDGTIQGLFELAGIPYVGCGVLGAAVGMDKAYTKIIFEKEGLPQGDYLVFNRKQVYNLMDDVVAQVEDRLTYPCFVKPSNAGSSVGVNKASDRESLEKALIIAAKNDRRILVEEFIDGREIECAVLGNDDPVASTVGEVVPCNEFYDYEAKYQVGDSSKVVIPAENLSEETVAKIREYAVRAFKCLDCAGLSRVDFFVHKDTGEIYINEINTLPGFTQISMYPKLWAASGIPYSELIDKLIELAFERYEDTRREYTNTLD
ncbi:D-alanine--D-alanine ligase family protein [Ruminiclostridium papyrosolvens]|uniref:D-alanine--D-alanine ligase n=1 Tax=Ruminiclostridium papyrosolvens C7 TaxID=1330534 RepID=U4R5C4_9FIRM|nr:D-alanine--D-alanine ligase family protein [Ruminiclostridium papyrosolvens]EPR13744.1 D-alanine--D-alanine ligase [Ruminiclostridium papyrosolvens C7]